MAMRGLSPEAARVEALRKFGDVRAANAACRRIGRERIGTVRRREYLSELRQDLVFGLRQLWKNPGFTLVAILTLALGVGGTTAIFSAVNAVVLRPVPVVEPDRLVYVFSSWRATSIAANVSPGNFSAWRERNTVFSSIAAACGWLEPQPDRRPGAGARHRRSRHRRLLQGARRQPDARPPDRGSR